MNFNVLKLGFQSFLQEKLAKENKEADFSLSDVSIFMYADEFKEYITDELKLSSSVYSVGINDILKMEFDQNGQLVDPNASEEAADETQPETEDGEQGTPDATQDDANMLANIMNDLLKDKTFSDAIDADGDGEVTDEEMDAFLNAIKNNDNDESNLSLDDLLSATQQIKDNEFSMQAEQTEEDAAPQVEAPTQTQSSGGNMGGGDFIPTQNNNNNNNNNTQTTESAESLKGKDLDELKEMLPTREEKLENAQTAVDEAIDAVHNNEAQKAVDEAFNNYVEFLEQIEENDAKFAEQIKAKEGEIKESQGKINEYDKQLADCLIQESSLTSTISDAETAISSLEGTKSSISSAMSSAETEEEKAALQSQLDNIEAAIDAQETKRDEAKEKLDTLQNETIPGIEKSKTDEQTNLTNLEGELDKLMADAEAEYPELAQYRDAYDKAKADFEEAKVTAQSNLDTALGNLGTAQTELNELNSAISVAETEKTQKENKPSLSGEYDEEAGQHLVDSAYEMLSRYGTSTGYCARGVSRTMAIALGIQMGGHGYQWDTNMEKLVEQGTFKEVTGDYATSADLANLPAGAVVCWENTSNSGGGGKQYGHVCIADGKGGEISDHYQASIYKSVGGRSDQYRVFIPIG